MTDRSTSSPDLHEDPDAADAAAHQAEVAKWQAIVEEYRQPNLLRASWQVINTLGGYVALWVLIYHAMQVAWWLAILPTVLAAGLVVRAFIIFHDCGHGSFFKSRLANDICGFICGVVTFTPYYQWRWEHAKHHATAGDLDRRGIGDIWTMTVEEYLAASRWKRFSYRLARNPFVLFVIAPIYLFLIRQRIPMPGSGARERKSVWWMNLATLLMVIGMSSVYGWGPYLVIQLTISTLSGSAGIWLFYIQHQFEDVYWERSGDWEYTAAALQGSSFYRLPKLLQWFSGNIGFHHIHHLSPRIPNYNLDRCHRSDPIFSEVKPVTIRASLKSLFYRLWDESSRELVGLRDAHKRLRERRRKP